MPPLPLNGTSYPPSTSGYAPLSRHDDEDDADLEGSSSRASTSSRVTTRTFTHSPYRSRANDPTDLLQTFLSDTRPHTPRRKELELRIRVGPKVVHLPLPEVTSADGLPFALADDVPALRGLPSAGATTWKESAATLLQQLLGRSLSRANDPAQGLQVYNVSQKKPLYATAEEVERYTARLRTGTSAPWAPLSDDVLGATAGPSAFVQSPADPPTEGSGAGTDDVDKLLSGSGGLGDFDLSSVFQPSRKKRSTRLVSVGLQEAVERFADDRHFSKRLVCRETVWGWDMARLQKAVRSVTAEAASSAKGKNRAAEHEPDSENEVDVELTVVGLDAGPVYHVVWAPIPFVSGHIPGLFASRTALMALTSLAVLLAASILLGLLANTLLILFAAVLLFAWGSLMYLVRTQTHCTYDTIGTAYPLAPRWMRLSHADASWDRERVLDSLRSYGSHDNDDALSRRLEQRGSEGWFLRRGVDQDEWLSSHREQLLHLLRPSH